MKFPLIAMILCGLCLNGSSFAQDENKPLPPPPDIENSRSPDGCKNVTFTWAGTDISWKVTVHIIAVKSGSSLADFAWPPSYFGAPYEVLWRPDSQAFCIKGEEARGHVQFRIYTHADIGHWRLVHHRDLVDCVSKKYGLQVYGKGGSHPFKWLSPHRLVVDVYDRSWPGKDGGDDEQPYQVTLRLPEPTASSNAEATIESIYPVSPHDTLFPR